MAYMNEYGDDIALIDAYHAGYLAFDECTACPHAAGPLADAWAEGKRDAKRFSRVRAVMPPRPEGYYHTKLDDI